MEIGQVDFEHTQRLVERKAKEALDLIFGQIKPGKYELNGEEVVLKIFYPPKLDPKERDKSDDLYGKWSFGVDVVGEGYHLEFIMYQSGWGGSPVAKISEVK